MPIGMIYKLTLLDPMLTPMSAQRTKELEPLEITTLTHVVDMVSEFSVIWNQESTHARKSPLTLTMQLILSGETLLSLQNSGT